MKGQTDTYAGETYLQGRTFEDYLTMKQKGRNVSIIASSTIFHHYKELGQECSAEQRIEDSFSKDSRGNR